MRVVVDVFGVSVVKFGVLLVLFANHIENALKAKTNICFIVNDM